MHTTPSNPTDISKKLVPNERVREPNPPRRWLDKQPGNDGGLDGVQGLVLILTGGSDENPDITVPPDNSRKPQQLNGHIRQPSQPPTQNIPNPVRNVGQRDKLPLTTQEPSAFLDIEGIPTGPLSKRPHRGMIGGQLGEFPDKLSDIGVRQTAKGNPQR